MSESISPGTIIGQYSVLSKIGEGGMGEVYRARDTKLGRDVAIKVLPAAFSADTERLRRFEQEAQAAGALNQVPKLGGTSKKLLTAVYGPVTLSPDGRRLAFVRSASEEDALIVANADGTGEQTLATLHSPEAFSAGGSTWSVVHGAPSWSPDGKVIACPATVKDDRESSDRRTTVVEVRVADGAIKAITSEKMGRVERVAWLHDGSGLLMITDKAATGSLNRQIWYLSYPGGEAQSPTT